MLLKRLGMVEIRYPDRDRLLVCVQKALRAWHSMNVDTESLIDQLLLVQKEQKKLKRGYNPIELRDITDRLLTECLDILVQKDETSAVILQERFIEKETIISVAYKLNMSQDQLNRRQREAINKLTEIIQHQERGLREEKAAYFESRLQVQSATELFGFDKYLMDLIEQVSSPTSPWVISLVGIGGIGKTSLADAVVRNILGRFYFEEVLWLRAESFLPETRKRVEDVDVRVFFDILTGLILSADVPVAERDSSLRWKIKSKPHLIVIDNLESEVDASKLIRAIIDLSNPSKFILTSRRRPPPKLGVFMYPLSELPLEDSRKLMVDYAEKIGLDEYISDVSRNAEGIYSITGGNPLALKLVIGLVDAMPLSIILQDLISSRPGDVESMYRHIYWKSWQALGIKPKVLLQAMPLVAQEGGTLENMRNFSGLDEAEFHHAVYELYNRSLLERRGSLEERRYGIHKLTETFLNTEIINWPPED